MIPRPTHAPINPKAFHSQVSGHEDLKYHGSGTLRHHSEGHNMPHVWALGSLRAMLCLCRPSHGDDT